MKIFFGWFIVAAAVVLSAYQSTMFVYGLTAFLTPIAATTGWSYTEISLAASLRGLQIGALDPVAGIVVDRWPARRLMLLGTVVFAAGTILVSQAPNLAVFYIGFLVIGLGSAFAQNIVPQTVIARWFKKNIGKASGFLALGFALGGLFVPLIVNGIEANGWRNMLLYMALGVLALGLPLTLLFRDRPEEYGMQPDGHVPDRSAGPIPIDSGPTLRQALKMRAFWTIGLAGMLQFTAVHAVTVHTIPYLISFDNMEASTAAIAVTIMSMVGLGARVIYGVLADVLPKNFVYAMSNGITAGGLVLLGAIDGTSFGLVVVFAVVYGLGVSGATPLRTPIAREYFGTRHFGTIFGTLSIFTVIGGTVGNPLAAWVYDTRGEYFPIWYIYAGLAVLGMISLLLLPSPPSDRLPELARAGR